MTALQHKLSFPCRELTGTINQLMEGDADGSLLPSLYFLGQNSEVLGSSGPPPPPSSHLLQLGSCSSHVEDEAFAQHSQPGLTSFSFSTHIPLDLPHHRHQISFAFTAVTSVTDL